MNLKEAYEARNPFRITDVKCDRKWVYDTYEGAVVITCCINGIRCEFAFRGARWNKVVGGLGIDCNSARVYDGTVSFLGGNYIEGIANGGGQHYYALYIDDRVVTSQPKSNQKDYRFTGQYYSTAPIINAFKARMQKLYSEGQFTDKFLTAIGLKESPSDTPKGD